MRKALTVAVSTALMAASSLLPIHTVQAFNFSPDNMNPSDMMDQREMNPSHWMGGNNNNRDGYYDRRGYSNRAPSPYGGPPPRYNYPERNYQAPASQGNYPPPPSVDKERVKQLEQQVKELQDQIRRLESRYGAPQAQGQSPEGRSRY